MKSLTINGLEITLVSRPRRKTIAISIKDNQVSLLMPSGAPTAIAEGFVRQKMLWIQKKLAEPKRSATPKATIYKEGVQLCFLGEHYSLKLNQSAQTVTISLNAPYIELFGRVSKLSNSGIKNKLTDWYKLMANQYLQERTQQLAKRTGLQPKAVEVKTYKARWGSCKINGDIQFNWKLIMAPPAMIDYVIIHELCHLAHHNHSAEFWHLVAHFSPNYKSAKNWFKSNGHSLEI
jgi:predicted metal-dependent hydrolase